jgi:hypothetical protein
LKKVECFKPIVSTRLRICAGEYDENRGIKNIFLVNIFNHLIYLDLSYSQIAEIRELDNLAQ